MDGMRVPACSRAGTAAVVLCLVAVACGSAVAPEDRLDLRFTSDHFAYHLGAGDTVDVAWQEAFHDWVTAALGIVPEAPLEYYKYRDADQFARVTGRSCCYAEDPPSRRFHTVAERDNHEMIHVLVGNAWGRAPGLLNEGLVVAHHANPLPAGFAPAEPHWAGRPIHDIARDRRAAGTVPDLDDLLDSGEFFAYPSGDVYPLAGSFVRYVADSVGLAPFRAYLAGSAPGDDPARTRQLFAAAFGSSLDAWWMAWLAFLAP